MSYSYFPEWLFNDSLAMMSHLSRSESDSRRLFCKSCFTCSSKHSYASNDYSVSSNTLSPLLMLPLDLRDCTYLIKLTVFEYSSSSATAKALLSDDAAPCEPLEWL